MTRPADALPLPRRSRLTALLEHFSVVEDPRDVRRILHPLPEILLLVVCGMIADCDSLPRPLIPYALTFLLALRPVYSSSFLSRTIWKRRLGA